MSTIPISRTLRGVIAAVNLRGMSARDKSVLITLLVAARSDDDDTNPVGSAVLPIEEIAGAAGMSRSSAKRALASLVQQGMIAHVQDHPTPGGGQPMHEWAVGIPR